MRIRLTFNVKNRGALVPFHHQYLISKVFHQILKSEGRGEYSNYPFYSFSGVKGQLRVSRNGLHYNSRKVTIVLSSASKDFIDHLIRLILKRDLITIGNLQIVPEIAEEEMSVDYDKGTKYVCISPFILIPPDHADADARQFIEPSSDIFSDYLYETTIHRMAEFGIDINEIPEAQKFQLVPDKDYLHRQKLAGKKFARIYPVYKDDQKHEVRGYTLPFTLYAAREIHDFLFTCGLGTLCNKGFGMLDVADADPTERTMIYASTKELISA